MGSEPVSAIDDRAQLSVITGLSAVLFFITLLPIDAIPEIPVDIDQKPFFVPLTLVALLPVGRVSLAVASGAALGEGMRDVLEGYEVDDTFGFVGYIVAFTLAGYLIGRRPDSKGRLVVASVVCAFVQAAFEGASFALLGHEGTSVAVESTLGNTFTHGVLGGAIPLVFVVPRFAGRIERFLGFEPKAWDGPDPLAGMDADATHGGDTGAGSGAALALERFSFAYPGTDRPALRDVTLTVRRGEIVGVVGAEGAGRTTLGMALAGLVPRVTGGRVTGRRAGSGAAAMVFADPASQLTQVHAADEVRAPLRNRGVTGAELDRRADELLDRVGLDRSARRQRVWRLPPGDQLRVALAAALAVDPEVLVVDGLGGVLDATGRTRLAELVRDGPDGRTVVLIDDDAERVADAADRVLVLAGGRLVADGRPEDVLGRRPHELHRVGVAAPTTVRLAEDLGLPERPLSLERVAELAGCRPGPARTAAGATGTTGTTGTAGAGPGGRSGEVVARLRGVGHRHDDGTVALDGVSLDVRAGTIHGLVGGDGAGKSTVIGALVALVQPTAGRVEVAGHNVNDARVKDLWGVVGAVLPDPDRQITESTVAGEIGYAFRRWDLPPGLVDDRVRELAGLVGLEGDLAADPRLLPRGRRRLVTVAAALALGPRLLVLDEPSAGLDAAGRARLHGALAAVRDRGVAVLLAENDVDQVAELADEVTVLSSGRVVHQGRVEHVLGEPGWRHLEAAGARPPRTAQVGRALRVPAVRYPDLVASAAREFRRG